ncbi:MAG TPA: hypothetical protein VML19_34675 [Verrucomicrobiae bacterium]|nr:hypothetical protein [Verrucomicrobiae bacterium]
MLARILGEFGYNVLQAGNGQDALDLIAGGQPIHVLIADYLLPGMSDAIWRNGSPSFGPRSGRS